jgi:hypothetical protein
MHSGLLQPHSFVFLFFSFPLQFAHQWPPLSFLFTFTPACMCHLHCVARVAFKLCNTWSRLAASCLSSAFATPPPFPPLFFCHTSCCAILLCCPCHLIYNVWKQRGKQRAGLRQSSYWVGGR